MNEAAFDDACEAAWEMQRGKDCPSWHEIVSNPQNMDTAREWRQCIKAAIEAYLNWSD